MTVNTIEMVRKIRDLCYSQIKDLSKEEQIKFIKEKAKKFQTSIEKDQCSTIDNTVQPSDII